MDLSIVIAPALTYIIPTVLGVIVGWLGVTVKGYKNQLETIDQIALMTCRQVIYSEHFDIDEKIDAYQLYTSKGGNHRTKQVMSEAVGMDIDEYLINHRKA